MKARWTVIALVVLGVLGVTLFLHYFERVPVKERVPPKGEADSEPLSPGAEFEPVSPLDVPAFLRRQSEG